MISTFDPRPEIGGLAARSEPCNNENSQAGDLSDASVSSLLDYYEGLILALTKLQAVASDFSVRGLTTFIADEIAAATVARDRLLSMKSPANLARLEIGPGEGTGSKG